jgi:hypothetical protein
MVPDVDMKTQECHVRFGQVEPETASLRIRQWLRHRLLADDLPAHAGECGTRWLSLIAAPLFHALNRMLGGDHAMSEIYVISYDNQVAGIVAAALEGFHVYASREELLPLEGRVFPDSDTAISEVRRLAGTCNRGQVCVV